MGTVHQIEALEQNMKDAKHVLRLKKSLDAAMRNPDFQLVIEKEYFTEEARRLVQSKSAPHMQTPEKQLYLDNLIMGIGALQQFFNKINSMAPEAERALDEDQNTHAELLEEEANV